MTAVRVALLADYREEGWPSMDRVAAMLHRELVRAHASRIQPTLVTPSFVRRATRVPALGAARVAVNVDRFLNRFWDYPRRLGPIAGTFDLFHVIDHSYAQIAHALPADRTVVTCHDLDAFRSLLDPASEPRSRPFRAATRRILSGLQSAACVTFDTDAIRQEMIACGLVRGERTRVAPPGVDDLFRAEPPASTLADVDRLLRPNDGPSIDLLHVGSTIPRKRIDVLLRVFGALRQKWPSLRLLRIGGPLTGDQQAIAREMGIADRVVTIPSVSDAALAAIYRRAAVVLQPSEREGFGLPVAEAMASGTPVVASRIDVLREVGGDGVEYCDVGDVDAWTRTVDRLLRERADAPEAWLRRRDRLRARADRFTWTAFADRIVASYDSIVPGAARHIA